ncbi:MAG TPA: hypothetical protein VFP61_08430 [Acidimicrobiales bacterium]|nr:hypothetical protein [Acidimicrobiales bacterium]
MGGRDRAARALLAGVCAVAAGGVAGLFVVGRSTASVPSRLPGSAPSHAASAPPATPPAPQPGAAGASPQPATPSAAALAAALVTPDDLGGYVVRRQPALALQILTSAPCVAGLVRGGASASAATALIGTTGPGLPTVVEWLGAFPGTAARAAFSAASAELLACPSFAVQVEGGAQVARVARSTVGPYDIASAVVRGTFTAGGRPQQLGVAVVRSHQVVMALVYVDGVTPVHPTFGDLRSTLVTCAGKLAAA